jgi:EAL domain-containing protein (putative c-di-GMP-specific phosphodiesterase class I)
MVGRSMRILGYPNVPTEQSWWSTRRFVPSHSGLGVTKICFEITATAAIARFSQANRFIQALKELGCRFALDDFRALHARASAIPAVA